MLLLSVLKTEAGPSVLSYSQIELSGKQKTLEGAWIGGREEEGLVSSGDKEEKVVVWEF